MMIERLPLPSARARPGTTWLSAAKIASTTA